MRYSPVLLISTTLASMNAATVRDQNPLSEEWTIESMQRVCNDNDTSCTWTFRVNTHAEGIKPTSVEYIVKSTNNTTASRSIGGPSKFGIFTVTSTWRDYFGLEGAWTTLSVIDYGRRLLVYPAYTDKQVEDGDVVKPDQVYVPENVPS
ncbi:unnamed protein product [Clonostachys chloroleuca]|uniref:Small secreted protein n=1 Tax=Clonostachys chloroleuca TaxID=1926264 RepID=A0AA35Q1P5_9HYPO|nr:unnamed protein product [Clonostachys chloroleuca]